ncbi:hypothetical protein FS749_011411 [Ceratobasidium sp. UAMH 11750]|nr:hypothetical protein FS749_011411 [Ceratobasidium sp. UAMH 11750]
MMGIALVGLGVTEVLVSGLKSAAEEVFAELLKAGTGEGSVKVDTLEQRVGSNLCLGGRREGALGTVAGLAETTESARVGLSREI